MNRLPITGLAVAASLASLVSAQTVITGNIATSQTLTLANSPYELQGDVYVLPGATLTIEPGVRFESSNNSTLAITRGAQIIAEGNQDAPITFTSSADNGVYRPNANNEWGNLTIMGDAYISESDVATNSAVPSASNFANMEGLQPANPSFNDYGGGNANDDSGTLAFCSFRYGGLAVAPGVELNGLSLGGIGRNTDIHHIEILNNLDDGIEVWGGTVNLKYLSIWNVGDDSLDIDQGWRGKAQFGLIVQGASNTFGQGSGFGDNALEIDGAERCDWQPVTTAAIHNFTVIGGGDPATLSSSPTDELVELRDNARVQFLNCIFMDAGKEVFNDKITDGEGANNTTVCGPGSAVPQMLTRMQTAASTTFASNAFPGSPELTPAQAYTAQNPAGNLVEVRGSIFFNNNSPLAYIEALGYGFFPQAPVAGTNNANNSIEAVSPITALTRSATETIAQGHSTFPVSFLDPTPTAIAQTAAEFSPNDGFYTSARYVGAFSRANNWLIGWTGASQFGLTTQRSAGVNEPIVDVETAGTNGAPVLYTDGNWAPGTTVVMGVDNLQDFGVGPIALLVLSTGPANPVNPTAGLPLGLFGIETLIPNNLIGGVFTLQPGVGNAAVLNIPVPLGGNFSGQQWYSQAFGLDTGLPSGTFTVTNAQRHNL
ncbi:MAG: hypothetical protein AB8H80_08615 [Planctomycetota bacterium]